MFVAAVRTGHRPVDSAWCAATFFFLRRSGPPLRSTLHCIVFFRFVSFTFLLFCLSSFRF